MCLVVAARAGNGTLATIIARCHACRDACDDCLAQLDDSAEARASAASTLRCVAFLSVIADTLAAADDCPTDLIDAAVEMARELPDDPGGCAQACRAAADALSEWLDGSYEHS